MLNEIDRYGPFLPNVRDTAIASSYADENRRRGLKSLSLELLNYEQETYEHVTTVEYDRAAWNGAGKFKAAWWQDSTGQPVQPEFTETKLEDGTTKVEYHTEGLTERVRVQHKMNELTARHVLSYGADDAICTAALANHFVTVMEIEDTHEVFEQVETYPAYLTALAYVQGVDFSLDEMAQMEAEDNVEYDKSWAVLRKFLIDAGFDGTVCPEYTELEAKHIKEAFQLVTGDELKTLVRTPDKLVKLVKQLGEELADEDKAETYAVFATVLGDALATGKVEGFNEYVKSRFTAEPQLDLASPKQMRKFLYDVIGLPVQIVNDVTPTEKEKQPALAEAIYKHKRARMGKPGNELTAAERELLKLKAKTDDTAIDYALAFDADYVEEHHKVALHAVQKLKKIMTRRSLFYKNYWKVLHWKDGKIHASANQCAAVTRRYSMSGPNLQQLPKKGEGVRFRGFFKPHHKDAVIVSIDFSGQELRLAAERSQDPNMLACYVGDKLKDIHSITAAGAMKLKWGAQTVADCYGRWGAGLQEGQDYDLFLRLRGLGKSDPMGKKADDLRKDSKNINFAAQFGGQAAKLSETLIMRIEDAQLFLDARSAMFPLVDRAAKRAAEFAEKHGYARTLMGARRHLRESILSDDKRTASAALRQAWNMEIQGSAGEMTKIGMSRLWLSGGLFKYDVRFIAPIHDELVTSVHKDHAVDFIKAKHEAMTGQYADMQVPILGSISLGRDFADQVECGDWYIADEIRKALDKCFSRELEAA